MASDQPETSSSTNNAQLLPWRQIYNGVYHSVGASLVGFGENSPQVMQRVTALMIDLTQPGIDFRVTPSTGEGNGLTVGSTICDFVDNTPGVVLAINANLSGPPSCTNPAPKIATSQLLGLAVSEGVVTCDPTVAAPCGNTSGGAVLPDVPDSTYIGCTSLMIYSKSKILSASIDAATFDTPPDMTNLWAAIAGSRNGDDADGVPRKPRDPQIDFIVKDYNVCSFAKDTTFAGRTGVGVTEDGKTIYIVIIEGLESTNYNYGGRFVDLANWMVVAGENTLLLNSNTSGTASSKVWRAVSLDGGGSSVMAGLDPLSKTATTFNIQYGNENGSGGGTPGSQRYVGNYFGIIADPL